MFDSYEGNTEDYSNLKSDNKEHARTSIESLKRFAREMAATPVDTVKRKQIKAWMRDPYRRAPNKAQYWPQPNDKARRELEDSKLWLLANAHELPRELENEQGRSGGKSPVVQGDYELDPINASKYEQHGLMFMGEAHCYESLLSIAMRGDEYERANPTSHDVTMRCLAKRGEAYKRHAEKQAKAARWRGMEGYDAAAKADEDMAKGLFRSKSESNAKPLPPIADLQALFVVDADMSLINRRLQRVVTGKKVKIAGKLYETSRVKFAVATGKDPGTKMVRGSVATHYRGAVGSVIETQYGWEAHVNTGSRNCIGVYPDEEQADLACKVYLKSLEMGEGNP